jgi:hypothetical protein
MLALISVIVGVYLSFKTVEGAIFGYLSRGAERQIARHEDPMPIGNVEAVVS